MLNKVKKILIIILGVMITLLIVVCYFTYMDYIDLKEKEEIQKRVSENTPKVMPEDSKKFEFHSSEDGIPVFNEIVYDGLTLDELATKLDKSLTSTLTGTGMVYAKVSTELGVDPYLMVSISLLETGCKWGCSYLTRECFNVGGVKGTPSCNGGAYRKYDSIEDGITKFIGNLAKNYYGKGLTTAEEIEYKYSGGSTTWAKKVNNYMYSVKSK